MNIAAKGVSGRADEHYRHPEMDYPVQIRQFDKHPSYPLQDGCASSADEPEQPPVLLPLLTRSGRLLSLLFQDGTVDLELASSVVALDPGLAFATLQLANRDRAKGSGPIWMFPLAVVAAGQSLLLRLMTRAPRIECSLSPGRRTQLSQLYSDAVLRACVAQYLARELGDCDPQKSFLAGLLLELPGMVKVATAFSPISPAALFTTICSTLPSAVVTASLAGPARDDRYDPLAPVGAAARIASSLLGSLAGGPTARVALEKLASGPLWRSWEGTNLRQRCYRLSHARELARWASANLYSMEPWEFMARLERERSWQ